MNFFCRVLITLPLLYLASCSKPTCREWLCQNTLTTNPSYNSGRIILAPESDSCHIELEIDRSQTGVRMYVNVLLLQAPPLESDPTRTSVEIIHDDGQIETIHPFLLTGGQRLLFPSETTERLIQGLLSEKSFTVKMGRQELKIILEKFYDLYNFLMKIPISDQSTHL